MQSTGSKLKESVGMNKGLFEQPLSTPANLFE